MKRIAIVGNRTGWKKSEVETVLLRLLNSHDDIVISGGASGVDTYAIDFAKEIGLQTIVIKPDSKLPSPKRYFDRNYKIANLCDILVAFNKKRISGTKNTINHAKRLYKSVIVINDVKA